MQSPNQKQGNTLLLILVLLIVVSLSILIMFSVNNIFNKVNQSFIKHSNALIAAENNLITCINTVKQIVKNSIGKDLDKDSNLAKNPLINENKDITNTVKQLPASYHYDDIKKAIENISTCSVEFIDVTEKDKEVIYYFRVIGYSQALGRDRQFVQADLNITTYGKIIGAVNMNWQPLYNHE